MADNAGNANELESLVTRLSIDSEDFMKKSSEVIARTDEMVTKLSAASGEIITLSGSISQIGVAMAQLMGQLTTTINTAVQSLNSVNLTTAGQGIGQVTGSLQTMLNTLEKLDKSAALGNVSATLGGLGTKLAHISTVTGGLGTLTGELERLFTWMNQFATGVPPGVANLTKTLNRFSSFFGGVAAYDTVKLQNFTMDLGKFFESVATMDVTKVAVVSGVMRELGLGLNALGRASKVDFGVLASNIAGAFHTLNGISISPNLLKLGTIMSQIAAGAKALKGVNLNALMGGGAGGGGGPPKAAAAAGGWFNWLTGSMNSSSAAAKGAGMSFRSMAYDMAFMQRGAQDAGASLMSLRYGLLGVAGLGLFQFARMDDQLTRTMAHVRDFDQGLRGELRAGIMNVTSQSTSSFTETAKSLDNLMRAGLSATGAIKALSDAENFAVASGMQAGAATEGLVNVLHGMGKVGQRAGQTASEAASEFRTNLTTLSDLLVGVASQSGATEKQMLEAFTSRFQTSSRLAKMSIEESVAILGALARAGDTYRGAKGGNVAARGIQQLVSTLQESGQWREMFGATAYDAEGQVKPIFEVLTMLQSKMKEVGTDTFLATLKKAGLGGSETTFAIEPLLRTVAAAKNLRLEMAFMAGSAEKAADTIRTSLQSQMMILWNNLSNVTYIVGERLAPALYLITKPLTDMFNAFAKLNPAVQNFIVYAGLALVAWRPMLWVFSSLTSMIVNLAISPFRLLYEATIGVGYALGSTLVNAVSMLGQAIASTFDLFVRLGHFLIYDLSRSILWFSTNVIGGVVMAVNNMLLAMVGLLALPVVIGLVAAPIATLVIGLVQLSSVIGTKMAQAWDAMKAGAKSGLEWIGNKVTEVTNGAAQMWTTLIQGARTFFANAAVGMSAVTGLLWNFRENFGVIIDYLDRHGDKMFEDLAWASMEAVDAIVKNFGKLTWALGITLGAAFKAAWGNVMDISMTFFHWFGGQWANIGKDLSTIFRSLFGSILNNFLVITETAFTILSRRAIDLVRWPSMTEKDREKLLDKRSREEFLATSDAINNLAGPFQGVKAEDFKTNFGDLGEMMTFTLSRSTNRWKIAGHEAAKAFSEAFAEMNPVLAAFQSLAGSDIWKMFFSDLNFAVPAFKEAGDFLKKALGMGEGGEGMGGALGKTGGPGFTFKQASMQRFEFGGQLNQQIQSQLLRTAQAIAKDVHVIAAQRRDVGPASTPAGPRTGNVLHEPQVFLGD
jgi:TP901 family phage tail tape measure protein